MDEPVGTFEAVDETRHGRARRLGSSALLWQSSTFLSAVTSIVLMLAIARVRGPEWFGDLSTYIFISGVGATIGAMGIPNSLAKYVSELAGCSNRPAVVFFSRKKIKAAIRFGSVAALCTFAVMALLFIGKGDDDFFSLIVIAISVLTTILFISATQLSVGLQDFKSILKANVVSKSFLVGAGLTVVILGFPLFAYLSVYAASFVIGALIQLRASRIFHSDNDCSDFDAGILTTDIEVRARSYERALWINSVLDIAVWRQSGVFFLWLLMGSYYSGQFSIAYTLTYTLISMVSGSIVSSLFPEFSKLYGSGDQRRGHSTFRVGFKANTLLVAPVATILAIGGTSLATILFGAEFNQAGGLISVLAITSGFVAIGGLATSYGYAQERHVTWTKIAVASSLIAVVLFLVLVPVMGLLGAVAVQAGVQVAGISIVVYIVAFGMKVQFPWKSCCIMASSAALSYLTSFSIMGLMFAGIQLLVAWSILGSIIYLLVLILLSTRDQDISMILRTAKTMMRAGI